MKRNIFYVFMACFCLLVLSSETFCMKRKRIEDQKEEKERDTDERPPSQIRKIMSPEQLWQDQEFIQQQEEERDNREKLCSLARLCKERKIDDAKYHVRYDLISNYDAPINDRGDTILHYAFVYGDAELVGLLIKQGLNVNL